jgi:hypothetical protein
MPFTNIDKSTAHFNTKTFTGNGSTQSITGVGFQPDWVWFKNRSSAQNHRLFDAVRGAGKNLVANNNGAEINAGTGTDGQLRTFDSDGFSVGSDNSVNKNSENIGVWNWKAGTTSIPSGSTSDPSAVSINTTAGFGIYKITAPSSGNYVLKHGLGATPAMVIVKRTDGTQKWMVWHKTFSNATDDYLVLNDTAAKATYSTCWGTMNSTDCTIATGGTLDTSAEHIIYVFTEKTGYSKFGEYVGNANANGRFIQTNFAVNFLMVKEYGATGNWLMWDNTTHNWNRTYRMANATDADNSADNVSVDLLSNGFKWRGNAGDSNGSGNILYMAFGQSIVGSNNTPALAR